MSGSGSPPPGSGRACHGDEVAGVSTGIQWTATATYLRATANDLGYRFGDEGVAALAVSRRVLGRVSGSLQLKAVRRGRSEFNGQGLEATGYTFVYLGPGLSVRLPGPNSLYAILQIPIHRHVNENQLAPARGLLVGINRSF